jgi:chemotaxis protein CheZ
MNEDLIIEKLKDKILNEISVVFSDILDQKFDSYQKNLLEGKFYKKMVFEMKQGLNDVYSTLVDFKKALREIQTASQDSNSAFQEVSDQLDAIVRSTERATTEIMDLAENIQQKIGDISSLAESANPEIADSIKKELNAISTSLLSIFTACSFQDITGQRIKKVVTAVKNVESKLLELLILTEVKIKGRENGKDEKIISEETKKAMDKLKGPQEKTSQDNVDSLLSEFGL